MPRGRAPTPSPGAGNRTDLVNPPPQPISAVPGQDYGLAANQQEAQQIAPMSGGGAPTPPGPGGQPQAPNPLAAAMGHEGPGASLAIDRPTERPNEPVAHGLPVGPGAGPEALQGVGAVTRDATMEGGTLTHLLASMAAQPSATSAIQYLAGRAASGSL